MLAFSFVSLFIYFEETLAPTERGQWLCLNFVVAGRHILLVGSQVDDVQPHRANDAAVLLAFGSN